jgi:hypothetical protein
MRAARRRWRHRPTISLDRRGSHRYATTRRWTRRSAAGRGWRRGTRRRARRVKAALEATAAATKKECRQSDTRAHWTPHHNGISLVDWPRAKSRSSITRARRQISRRSWPPTGNDACSMDVNIAWGKTTRLEKVAPPCSGGSRAWLSIHNPRYGGPGVKAIDKRAELHKLLAIPIRICRVHREG